MLLSYGEVTVYMLPHLKCIRLLSVRLSLPSINIGVRIELALILFKDMSASGRAFLECYET